ncbi:uncharacterized protein [Argopecten irradians]|uniref:uncharacterized protein n=1 Tax=Argopecten irradians TaxID=31199 RepID=UPI003723BC1C
MYCSVIDGSDEGDENEPIRQSTSTKKSENTSNQKRNTVGVCGAEVKDFIKSNTEKEKGRRQHPEFKHESGRSPQSSPPPSPPPPPGSTEFPFSDRRRDRSEELSSEYAIKHGDLRLLRALTFFPECEKITDRGLLFPLHTAASLGLKRATTFLLQSGFDLDERDGTGCTPIESTDCRKNKPLFEYMRRIGGIDSSPQSTTHGQGDDGIEPRGGIASVTMERIDLSTRTIYFPSEQFRTTCREGHTTQKVFFVAPFVTKYKTVCMYQMYGLLYALGHCKTERNIRQCLSHAILPEADLMKHKDCNSGVFKFDAWLHSSRRDRRGDHTEEIPSWISSLLQGTAYSQSSVSILCDGWTPMHYAILMQNDDLVKHLLQTGEGHLKDKAYTLLPKFILDILKGKSRFEYYEYVYSHIEGFTPLMLATFIENVTALELLFQDSEQISSFACTDIDDALSLAYCDRMESVLLYALCKAGKDYLSQNHQIDVNLEPHYRKENPLRRILFAASTDVIDKIEEDFFTLEIRVENKAIISEYLYTTNNLDVVSEEDDTLLAETIECHSDRLWKRHSSLNAIIPGHISVVRDGCPGYDKTIIVVFYSNDKELTPSSEIPFQEYLFTNGSKILVHVVEGFFRFDSTVHVGQSIDYKKSSINSMRATLGPFVQSSQNKKGVLTCAHTFLEDFFNFNNDNAYHDVTYDPEMPSQLRSVFSETNCLTIYKDQPNTYRDSQTDEPIADDRIPMDCKDTQQPCGYLRRLLLRPDKDVGIDVALILFNDDDTVTCSPQLHLGHPMFRQQLQQHRVPSLDHLKFEYDREIIPRRSGKVCKCGMGTGFTVGNVLFDKATGQIKVSDDSLPNEPLGVQHGQRKFIMRGQIVVQHHTESFFAIGDSGAAVFLFEGNCPTKCLGIGIGHMINNPVSLVTPIRPILEELSEDQNTTFQLLECQRKDV